MSPFKLISAAAVLVFSLGVAYALGPANPSATLTVTVTPSQSPGCTVAPCPGSILPAGTTGWVVGFDEEFLGTSLNTNTWSVPPDGGTGVDGKLQNCNGTVGSYGPIMTVNNGLLTFKHNGAPDNYECAIHTNTGFTFGYYEAKVKTSNNPDGWGGFWIVNHNNSDCAGLFEYGFESDIIETNVPASEEHLFWDGYKTCGHHTTVASNLPHGDAFHIYGFWLQPTGFTWYVDGTQTASYTYSFPNSQFVSGVSEWEVLSNLYISGAVDNGFYADWVRFYHQ